MGLSYIKPFSKTNLKYPGLWQGCTAAYYFNILDRKKLSIEDLSGHKIEGSFGSELGLSSWIFSKGNLGINFDGTLDESRVALNSRLVLTKPCSVFVWFKGAGQTSNSSSILRPFIIQEGVSSSNPVDISMIRDGHADHGKIRWNWGGTVGNTVVNGTSVTNDNEWHSCGGVLYEDDSLELFVDGESEGTAAGGGNHTPNAPVNLGGSPVVGASGEARHFAGQIAEVRIYNRALTHSDFALLARKIGISYEQQFRPLRIPLAPSIRMRKFY